jgi:hypothetical protein
MSYELANLAGYLSSGSASAMIETALQLGTNVGCVLLNVQNMAGSTSVAFSGSWSNVAVLQLKIVMRLEAGATSATASVMISTDGGTTGFLSMNSSATLSGLQVTMYDFTVMGGDNRAIKIIQEITSQSGRTVLASTVTNSAGFINYIRYASSATIGNGQAYLFGFRNA